VQHERATARILPLPLTCSRLAVRRLLEARGTEASIGAPAVCRAHKGRQECAPSTPANCYARAAAASRLLLPSLASAGGQDQVQTVEQAGRAPCASSLPGQGSRCDWCVEANSARLGYLCVPFVVEAGMTSPPHGVTLFSRVTASRVSHPSARCISPDSARE